MEGDPDYIVDVSGLARTPGDAPARPDGARPYICVYFECCGVYNRVYRRPQDALYVGWCPKCLRKVRVRVGPNGVSTRFFRAT